MTNQENWISNPDAQGWWWHWTGDQESAPFMYSVMVSHTGTERYFIAFPDSRWCDEVGGLWIKAEEPKTWQNAAESLPAASTDSPAIPEPKVDICHYHNGPFKEECPLGGKCERIEDWGNPIQVDKPTKEREQEDPTANEFFEDDADFCHDPDCPCYSDQHSRDCKNCECQCQRPPEGWRCTRGYGHTGPCAAAPVPTNELKQEVHEWLGCEEVNGWFVSSCSCGWTYQHPNYGTTQETFVNHWGDHIRASQPSDQPTQKEAQGTYADGFIDGREYGYSTCGSCEHPWGCHDGECGAYMKDGSICGCRKLVGSVSWESREFDELWASHAAACEVEPSPEEEGFARWAWNAALSHKEKL